MDKRTLHEFVEFCLTPVQPLAAGLRAVPTKTATLIANSASSKGKVPWPLEDQFLLDDHELREAKAVRRRLIALEACPLRIRKRQDHR